jgi:hypothetical protein
LPLNHVIERDKGIRDKPEWHCRLQVSRLQ